MGSGKISGLDVAVTPPVRHGGPRFRAVYTAGSKVGNPGNMRVKSNKSAGRGDLGAGLGQSDGHTGSRGHVLEMDVDSFRLKSRKKKKSDPQ